MPAAESVRRILAAFQPQPFEADVFECEEVVIVDAEFRPAADHRPEVLCVCAKELYSGKEFRLWRDELGDVPPFVTNLRKTLYVAYGALAEMSCHLARRWPLPPQLLDLYVEFRNATNGQVLADGAGLLGALAYFGEAGMDAGHKEAMRMLALRPGDHSPAERKQLLDYCWQDVEAEERVLLRHLPDLDLPRALHRGAYLRSLARIIDRGLPIDAGTYASLAAHWPEVRALLLDEIAGGSPFFKEGKFSMESFAKHVADCGYAWPRTPTGRLKMDRDTFADFTFDEHVATLKDSLRIRDTARIGQLPVGSDGRVRTSTNPFRATTSRDYPKGAESIFTLPAHLRHLIVPAAGEALAYLDWSQQEYGIAAALSRDPRMLAAYRSGDAYAAFAEQMGWVPEGASRGDRAAARERAKRFLLGILYGMGVPGIARRMRASEEDARGLLGHFRLVNAPFHEWMSAYLADAQFRGHVETVFGWRLKLGPFTNVRALRNFPMQANAAEMLRLACILCDRYDVEVCATVHDAIVIRSREAGIHDAVRRAEWAMARASEIVLDEVLTLRCGANVFLHPERFVVDERGGAIWMRITELLAAVTHGRATHAQPA